MIGQQAVYTRLCGGIFNEEITFCKEKRKSRRKKFSCGGIIFFKFI